MIYIPTNEHAAIFRTRSYLRNQPDHNTFVLCQDSWNGYSPYHRDFGGSDYLSPIGKAYCRLFGSFVNQKKFVIFDKLYCNESTTDILRNNIIDKLLTINNKDYLSALYQLVNKSSIDNDIVELTKEQILMLQLSDEDIKAGKLISQDQLDQDDLKWLKEV